MTIDEILKMEPGRLKRAQAVWPNAITWLADCIGEMEPRDKNYEIIISPDSFFGICWMEFSPFSNNREMFNDFLFKAYSFTLWAGGKSKTYRRIGFQPVGTKAALCSGLTYSKQVAVAYLISFKENLGLQFGKGIKAPQHP